MQARKFEHFLKHLAALTRRKRERLLDLLLPTLQLERSHRFLALTKNDRPRRLAGIAEADEMYVLESHKGSRSLDRAPRKRT